LGRGLIEPLHVVDGAQQRPVLRGVRHQAEGGQRYEKRVGSGPRCRAERGVQRLPLRVRQTRPAVEQWIEKPLEPRERQLHVRFDPRRLEDLEAGRAADHVLQQGRLPDPGFASQHEHLAPPGANFVERPLQCSALGISPEHDGR
jgi:hypothetical protein